MTPGGFADLTVRIENLGADALESEPPNPVHLSYRWFEDAELVGHEADRAVLPAPLDPGAEVTLSLPVAAPEAKGSYELRVALVQEHVAWFDDVDPLSGASRPITVARPLIRSLRSDESFAARFPAPELPWTTHYARRHRAFVAAALDDRGLSKRFRERRALPDGYGYGFDERVIEFPWLFAQEPRGRMLDAGSTLNHRHLLERLGERARALTIVTLAPESSSFPELGVTYLYEDLRALPLEDASFETAVCLSTLEHVGMDNTRFGAPGGRSRDPLADRERAVAELRRVTVPGGTLLITVPYGRPVDHGWILQFGREDVARLHALLEPLEWSVEVFEYSGSGWQRGDLESAGDARFEDHAPGPHPTPDRAAAARAVACIRAVLQDGSAGPEAGFRNHGARGGKRLR
jgi:SAM-dependent methyltransferase